MAIMCQWCIVAKGMDYILKHTRTQLPVLPLSMEGKNLQSPLE